MASKPRPFKFDSDKPAVISVRVHPDDFGILIEVDKQAQIDNRTRSNLIWQIVKDWLKERESAKYRLKADREQ